MSTIRKTTQLLVVILLFCQIVISAPSQKWTERKANQWYATQPFISNSLIAVAGM